MNKKFDLLFLTLFGVGKIKYASGTVASFITCIFFLFLNNFISISIIFFISLVIFLYSLIAINNSFDSFDTSDPQEIVIDEFVGQMLVLLAIPIYETLYPTHNLYYCILGFLLFRFFDVIKPFPISYIDDNTTGAFGIMFDDIVAGFFSIIVLIIVFFFIGG